MTEDWAEIRRLHKSEQMSIKAIVRKTRLARNTVRAASASNAAPGYVAEETVQCDLWFPGNVIPADSKSASTTSGRPRRPRGC